MRWGAILVVTFLAACSAGAPESAARDGVIQTETGDLRITTVVSGLEHPWGLAFLPDGRMR